MKTFLAVFLAGIVILGITNSTTQAHIVVRDSSGSHSAILYISPDDDPALGTSSTIFFDIAGNEVSTDTHELTASVASPDATSSHQVTVISSTSVSFDYTFETVGRHLITFDAAHRTTGVVVSYAHEQTITRGGDVAQTKPVWAYILIGASVTGVLVTASVIVFRRRRIAQYTNDA